MKKDGMRDGLRRSSHINILLPNHEQTINKG
jgi:hypothetical protein